MLCKSSSSLHTSPGHGATLVINGNYITSHLPKEVKEASYRREMIDYITANARWSSPDTFELVDWEAKAYAYKRIKRDSRITVTKLEFGLFATMYQKHCYYKETSSLCPRCNEQPENFDHVLRCPAAGAEVLANWQDTKTAIRIPYTCASIINIFDQGLSRWLQGQDPGDTPPRKPDQQDAIGWQIHQAFVEQCTIGWGQAIRGRISRKWGAAHRLYRRARYNSEDSTVTQWSANLIFHLWRLGIDRWIARNNLVYGKTEQERSEKRNSEINLQITKAFLLDQDKIRHEDKHLFDLPRDSRLNHSCEQKRLWLASVRAAIRAWERDKKAEEDVPTNENSLYSSDHAIRGETRRNAHHDTEIYDGRRPRVRLRK